MIDRVPKGVVAELLLLVSARLPAGRLFPYDAKSVRGRCLAVKVR